MSVFTQTNFADAVFWPEAALPPGLAAWNGSTPARRFGVYRNNVLSALTQALAARFPATEKLVGQAFFVAMAAEFVRLHPPRSPLLLSYGDDFADFVEGFEPAAGLVYLPDVIRLEAARGRAYHAADMVPLDPAELAAIRPESLAGLTFAMHPSTTILRSPHPVVSIWSMNAGDAPPAALEDWESQDALVVRPQLTVEVVALPPGGARFLEALSSGDCLGSAIEAACEEADDFDPAANLAGALQSGVFIAVGRSAGPSE